MDVAKAVVAKHKLEADVFDALKLFESETDLEVAAVLIDRIDISQMGEGKKSQLSDIDIIVGVDVPPTPIGGMV